MISDKYPDLKIPIIEVIATIRRLKSQTWNQRNTNSKIVQEITGHGSCTASNICHAIQINPYGYEII